MISSKVPNPSPTKEFMREKRENIEKQGKTTIWRPHGQKYQTSEWYTGSGEITNSDHGLSFEVTATYQLKAEVKLVKGIFAVANPILADVYRSRGRYIQNRRGRSAAKSRVEFRVQNA